MAKKTHLKLGWYLKANLTVRLFIMLKNLPKGEKAKVKLKIKKYNPNTRKHEFFVEKKVTTSQ